MENKRIKKNSAKIPENIKAQVDEIVKDFNEKFIHDPKYFYVTRYKGSYLYLDRYDYESFDPVCRLKYTSNIQNWECALMLYRFTSDRYKLGNWISLSSSFVDGTIVSAMKAGLKIDPL